MDTIAQYDSSDEEDQAPDHSAIPDQPGRIRTFPHVPGNFAVHVYVEVNVPASVAPALATLLRRAAELLPELHPVDGTGEDPLPSTLVQPSYHISLSRTVPIKLPEADPLLTSLGNALHSLRPFRLSIEPELEVYVNDEHTRTFLALRAAARPVVAALLASGGSVQPGDPLVDAIAAVSDAFEQHSLSRFYEQPRLHISLAWLLGDEMAAVATAIGQGAPLDAVLAAALEELRTIPWELEPEAVWCRVGARRSAVWRRKR